MTPRLFAPSFLAAAFLMLAAVPAAMAQKDDADSARWRPPASGPARIVLYSDTNLRGTSVELSADEYNFSNIRFNDKARSVEVKGGVWLLCADANLRGRCEYVDRTVRNLGEIGLSGSISSAQVTAYDKGPRSYDIAFFADGNFRGPFLGFDQGEASLSQFRFNDTASSVIVNRGTWLVCADNDYRGQCEFLDASVSDLGAIGLNDRISSFRKYDVRKEGPWRPPVTTPGFPGRRSGERNPGRADGLLPGPGHPRGQRISNTSGAATRFCQDQGFYEAVYKAPGSVLSDVLCR